MFDAAIAAPLLLVLVLVSASAAKWRHPDELISASRSLRLPSAAVAASRHVPMVEAVLAVGLLVSPWPVSIIFAAAALGLMLAYTAVIAKGLSMTPRPSCGCFGRIGHPITVSSLVRNIVLSALGVIAVVWTATGHSVPGALWRGGWPMVGWLVALVATAAVVWWIVSERTPAPVNPFPAPVTPAPAAQPAQPSADEVDGMEEEYVREVIPPIMLVQDDKPVTLRALAEQKAQLLVWITCGCGRSHEAVELVARWAEMMPAIDVRLVSTQTEEVSKGMFPSVESWLLDPGAGAMMSLGMQSDPAAVLLGADGMLAGGPVEGVPALTEFGELIAEQLGEVDELPAPVDAHPTPTPAPIVPMDANLVRLWQGDVEASVRDLGAGERLMLLLVSEYCHSCEGIRTHADQHAAALAERGVRAAVVYPFAPGAELPHDPSLTWVDQDATMLTAFGVNATPAALLFAADGSLEQGPFVGSDHVAQFIASVTD